MNKLFLPELNQSFIDGFHVTVLVLFLIALVCVIALFLRLIDAKNQIKHDEAWKVSANDKIKELEDWQKMSTDLTSELQSALENMTQERNEVKKSFTDSVAEINKLVTSEKYWKERALHQKHTPKLKDSDWWKCLSNEYKENTFVKGKIYEKSKEKTSTVGIFLIGEDGVHYLVFKSDFIPVEKPIQT